jgi:type I restriction enzyme M protein
MNDVFSAMGNSLHLVKLILPFVQHMVHQLDDNGTGNCFPHGVLFRGGAEGHIRQYLIKGRITSMP